MFAEPQYPSDDEEDSRQQHEEDDEELEEKEGGVSDDGADAEREEEEEEEEEADLAQRLKERVRKQVDLVSQVKFVPMRLTDDERVLLKVLEQALEVCEYTDIVDVTFSHTHKSKHSRILECLVDVLSISCGLLMANNLSKGEALIADRSLNANIPFFRDLFEVGRRYKIMNPHAMRSTYGKLMYIVMDCESPGVKSETGASFVKDIVTVHAFLQSKGVGKEFVRDGDLCLASAVVEQYDEIPVRVDSVTGKRMGPKSKSNGTSTVNQAVGSVVTRFIKRRKSAERLRQETDAKRAACDRLIETYSTETFTAADIRRVVESLCDNNAYFAFNVRPVERMLTLLKDYFPPEKPPAAGGKGSMFSLALGSGTGSSSKNAGYGGRYGSANSYSSGGYSFSSLYDGFSMRFGVSGGGGGAKLSHNHATQYVYVTQSLSLWREIMVNMPRMWFWADLDMVSEPYRLCDTGQGYQRVQQCPNVRQLMTSILSKVQGASAHHWVGLSVVHLGDRDVPNALTFIDKYTQVPRLLSPIANCIDSILALTDLRPPVLPAARGGPSSTSGAAAGAELALPPEGENGDAMLHSYVTAEWGSVDGLALQILSDFFKHGFDGSGDDGGSCIDGRLTSAWNWCSKIQKKPFYHIFMFTGFQGFDGDWKG